MKTNKTFLIVLFSILLSSQLVHAQKIFFNKNVTIDTLHFNLDLSGNISEELKTQLNEISQELIEEFNSSNYSGYRMVMMDDSDDHNDKAVLSFRADSITFATKSEKRTAFWVTAFGSVVCPVGMVYANSSYIIFFWLKALNQIHGTIELSNNIRPQKRIISNLTNYLSVSSGWFRSEERLKNNLLRRYDMQMHKIFRKLAVKYNRSQRFKSN